MAGVFEAHDRSRFEVRAYSYGPDDGSALRSRLTRAFDGFVDARAMSDAELAEWVFAQGLRPNRMQTVVWNEYTRKLGWNDRITPYLQKQLREEGVDPAQVVTSLDLIEVTEGRPAAAARG